MKYILFLSSLILLASCDVLDKTDLSAIPEDKVWSDVSYATAYVNKLCRDNLPGWDYDASCLSDEAAPRSKTEVMYGQLTSSSIDTWNYTNIRNINIFLESIESGGIDEETKNQLKGQVYFLRAWQYFGMVRQYGGVPIIEKPQSLSDDIYVARNKTSECIDFIVGDLDKAAAGLPWHWSNKDVGRITKAAALAMKGRILLYYASPQFNPEKDMSRWEKHTKPIKWLKMNWRKTDMPYMPIMRISGLMR